MDFELIGEDERIVARVLEINQTHGNMLCMFAEWHVDFPPEPFGKFFVGAYQADIAHRKHNGPEFPNDFIGKFGVRRNFRIDAAERGG